MGSEIPQPQQNKFSRRDFLKFSCVGLGALAFRPFNPKTEISTTLPESPINVISLETSTYLGHTNVAIGFTNENRIHVSLMPEAAKTIVDSEGNQSIVANNTIQLNAPELTPMGMVNTTPIVMTDENILGHKESEFAIAKRYEAQITITPECLVTESTDDKNYDISLKLARERMIKMYGDTVTSGVLILDFVNKDGIPDGKRVSLVSNLGEIVKTVWVTSYGTNPNIPIQPGSEIGSDQIRRGRARIALNLDQVSPFPLDNSESPEGIESLYKEELNEEQLKIFEESDDKTTEGLSRRFLDGDLGEYLAYVDVNKDSKDFGEVVAVWNPEQKKSNPALLIENNLFINENSASQIIWNPEVNRAEAKQKMADYMKYVRLKLVAEANGIDLPNRLEDALANEDAQKLLTNGGLVTLNSTKSESHYPYPYSVPVQQIYIGPDTSLIFKSVNDSTPNMVYIGGANGSFGWSIDQKNKTTLTINYFNGGGDTFQNSKNEPMRLMRRLYYVAQNLFSRVSNNYNSLDVVTAENIFNTTDLSTKPLIIFSKTR